MTPNPAMPIAEFSAVAKNYGAVVAVQNLDLSVRRGEFLSFLGPSGCGKTTALRMLAGLETPTTGEVRIDGERMNDVPAYRRQVNMVFQQYALFPNMTVAENVGFGLRQRRPKPPASEVSAAVTRALDLVRLPGFETRRIWEMSGGQQQRVALARAIVNEPKLLLLDEPMAALDKSLRHDMQIELKALQRELGITFILVTHDQEEALSMSDRICVMGQGRIMQLGTPEELYDRPANRYVANFVGRTNFIEGRIDSVVSGLARLSGPGGVALSGRASDGLMQGDAAVLSLRPEQIRLAPATGAAEGLPVTITNRIFLGERSEYHLHHADLGALFAIVPRNSEEDDIAPGTQALAIWHPEAALVIAPE